MSPISTTPVGQVDDSTWFEDSMLVARGCSLYAAIEDMGNPAWMNGASWFKLLDELVPTAVCNDASSLQLLLDKVALLFGGMNSSRRWHVDAACFLFWALLWGRLGVTLIAQIGGVVKCSPEIDGAPKPPPTCILNYKLSWSERTFRQAERVRTHPSHPPCLRAWSNVIIWKCYCIRFCTFTYT